MVRIGPGKNEPLTPEVASQIIREPLRPELVADPPTGDLLIFDIETGPLPLDEIPPFDESTVKFGNTKDPGKRAAMVVKAKEKYIEKAALSPLTGQVVAVGLYTELLAEINRNKYNIIGRRDPGQPVGPAGEVFYKDSEADVLRVSWDIITGHGRDQVVGHNIFGFDLPFLVNRSRILGVPIPEGIFTVKGGRVYWADIFVDTMKLWTFGAPGEYVKLGVLATALGVGGKPDGITGADFARLWNGTPEERAMAVEYLKNDLRMTAWVAHHLGVV